VARKRRGFLAASWVLKVLSTESGVFVDRTLFLMLLSTKMPVLGAIEKIGGVK
jgi:hypothetical protein